MVKLPVMRRLGQRGTVAAATYLPHGQGSAGVEPVEFAARPVLPHQCLPHSSAPAKGAQ